MQKNFCYSLWLAAILTILFVATLTPSPSKNGSEESVRKGLSKDHVLAMVGPPKSKQHWSTGKETWYYDGCYIRFENDKVIAFSGLCTGLTSKVKKSRENPPRVAKGLSRKRVLAILGPPFTKRSYFESREAWEYRDCSVIFEDGKVVHCIERNLGRRLGRRTKGSSVKGRPRVNKERTKSAIVATQLTPEELEKQKALEQAIIKEMMQRRKAEGVSGEHCETEYKTNAEVCIEITGVDLDCNESYLGNYYQDCDVSISYDIATDYKGGSYLDVDIGCRVEIEYEGRQTYFTNSESSSSDESHNLYAHGSDSNTMSFNFSFSSFDEVVKATISSTECEIESVNLW
jgi:hypothetical protein